jgi:hypothetical protein
MRAGVKPVRPSSAPGAAGILHPDLQQVDAIGAQPPERRVEGSSGMRLSTSRRTASSSTALTL